MNNENYGPKFGQKVEILEDARGASLRIFGARTMYANVNKPRPSKGDKVGGYDCEFMIPKDATGVKEAVEFIRSQAKLHFPGLKPKLALIRLPDMEIRDLREQGLDVPDGLAAQEGMVVFKGNSSAKVPPSVKGNIYSGCYAGAVIGVAKYDSKDSGGQRFFGIKGYLNIVQFQGDGEPFSGRVVDVDAAFGVATPESTQRVQEDAQAPGQHDDFTQGLPGYGDDF